MSELESKTNMLEPCPFCGGDGLVSPNGIYGLVEHKSGCFFIAAGLPTKNQRIMRSEFGAWNRREMLGGDAK